MSEGQKNESIDQVLELHQEGLMSISGVVGVGIGEIRNSPAIVVMLKEDSQDLLAKVPRQLGGFPVKIDVVGEISAF